MKFGRKITLATFVVVCMALLGLVNYKRIQSHIYHYKRSQCNLFCQLSLGRLKQIGATLTKGISIPTSFYFSYLLLINQCKICPAKCFILKCCLNKALYMVFNYVISTSWICIYQAITRSKKWRGYWKEERGTWELLSFCNTPA